MMIGSPAAVHLRTRTSCHTAAVSVDNGEKALSGKMMQQTRRAGPRRVDGSPANQWCKPCLAVIGLLVFLLLGGPMACNSGSYDQASDGPKIYVDQLSDSQKAADRDKIVQSLKRGIGIFDLGVGDQVEIFFHVNRHATARVYSIKADDKLRIDFLGDTENSRTVQVQPDGLIYLPLIGSVIAAGQTAEALGRAIERGYSGILTEPKVTVNVSDTHTPLGDFIDVVSSLGKGRSLVDEVLPDGTISVPLLTPLRASGRTLKDVEHEIDAGYAAKGLDVFVSLVPRVLRANATSVIGEVGTPGRFELQRPTTVLMAVARAGGVLATGSMSAVRVYYVSADGVPHVRSVNLDNVMDNLALEDDMIVPSNSIIYVPPTELAATGRFLDATLRDVLQYQGIGVGGALLINQ